MDNKSIMLYSCQIKSCPQAFVFIRALSVRVGDCVLIGGWGQKKDKEKVSYETSYSRKS